MTVGKTKKEKRQLEGDIRPKPHTKKEMKEKRLKKRLKELEREQRFYNPGNKPS